MYFILFGFVASTLPFQVLLKILFTLTCMLMFMFVIMTL